jgi:hypothetical protein
MMMSEGILKSIEDLSGCVYTKPLSSVPKWQFNQTGREDEYRSLTDTDYDYAVRVDHTCLPADTLVIGGSNQVISSIWDAVKSGVHPLDVSTGTGTITTLSGVWSVEDHPDYRQRV